MMYLIWTVKTKKKPFPNVMRTLYNFILFFTIMQIGVCLYNIFLKTYTYELREIFNSLMFDMLAMR